MVKLMISMGICDIGCSEVGEGNFISQKSQARQNMYPEYVYKLNACVGQNNNSEDISSNGGVNIGGRKLLVHSRSLFVGGIMV